MNNMRKSLTYINITTIFCEPTSSPLVTHPGTCACWGNQSGV